MEEQIESLEIPVDAAPSDDKKRRDRSTVIGTVLMLCAAVAAAVLMAYVWMPVLQIYGKSMDPTLGDGDIVVTVKTSNVEAGDIIAIDFNNKLLIRRVIGVGGDTIHISESGTVTVNNEILDEPYIREHHSGEPTGENPCTVPTGSCYVLGDSRETAVDSRHREIGCITEEQIIGKVILQVWPMNEFGFVK